MIEEYPSRQYSDLVHSPEFHKIWIDLSQFANACATKCPTFALWLLYIEMVQTLLLFLRATRDNDWSLHLAAVRSMLPWFFSCDRVHYARYGTAYWMEMSCIDKTHPGNFLIFSVLNNTGKNLQSNF